MNLKLKAIKDELRKMLLEMSVTKTDKGVLQYEDEELKEGTVVKIVNEDGTEEIPTGEFTTEDNKKLTIENGEVKTIEEIEVQPVEVVEPIEETPEEVTEEVTEETIEEVTEETPEEVVEETPEEVTEETPEEVTDVAEAEDVIPALEAKIAELEAKLAEALAKIAELTENTETIFSKIEKMSMAKPAAQEFESVKKMEKTGIAKVDRFLERING